MVTQTRRNVKLHINNRVMNFDVSLTVHLSLANDQLDAQFFLLHLLQSSTCFEQCLAHPQDVKLY